MTILKIPEFEKELKLGINGKIFKVLWFDGLNNNSTCHKQKSFNNFDKLCVITYDKNGHSSAQICSKCRTRKISLKANPPETKSAKASKANFKMFCRFWPEIVKMISSRCKNFPESYSAFKNLVRSRNLVIFVVFE